MINKFSCNNFRNICIEELELSKINIFVGPNNAGKTNLIRALTFYSNMLKHSKDGNEETDFLNAVSRNDWGHSLNRYEQQGTPIGFRWDMDLGEKSIVYSFKYKTGESKSDFKILLEEMSSSEINPRYDQTYNFFRAHDSREGSGQFSTALENGSKNKRIPFELSSKASICSQFNDILIRDSEVYSSELVRKDISNLIKSLEETFKSFYLYSSSRIETRSMRRPTDEKERDDYLKNDCSNFVNVFRKLKSESLAWKGEYIKNLRMLMRNLEDIDVVPEAGNLKMRILDNKAEYELSDVSEGTLKVLIWNLLFSVSDRKRYGLLALDEPENNLHPAWQKVVCDWIINSNTYEQCIISSHSPDFLDGFTELFKQSDEVKVFSFDGLGSIRRIIYKDIMEDMGDWYLGDLYRVNDPSLGG